MAYPYLRWILTDVCGYVEEMVESLSTSKEEHRSEIFSNCVHSFHRMGQNLYAERVTSQTPAHITKIPAQRVVSTVSLKNTCPAKDVTM